MQRYILALDQGTTSSRALLFTERGTVHASASQEFPQLFPSPGHVEHDPEAIWGSQVSVAKKLMADARVSAADIAAIGIANQRETTILWDRATGTPIQNAIVWQSRITAAACEQLKSDGYERLFRERTGLPIDAYFSGTKIAHILDAHPGVRERAERGEVLFGTVETFLVWRLTGGAVHVTDPANASRTLLFDIHAREWDDELLRVLGVPRAMLPAVRSNSEVYGETAPDIFGAPIPISGIAGDQQAATFGQACFRPGMAKQTYGTGAFMLMNTGAEAVPSENGLLTTVAWGIDGNVTYALEGSVFVAGAAVQWMRDGLRAITRSADVETLAGKVQDAGGVYVVPAFVGLGAPYWDPYARGTIVGLTRGSSIEHIARAVVESMGYQTREVLEAMEGDSGVRVGTLRVDGGAAVNDGLMQFQADILGSPVERPQVLETTALGAAYLAGMAVGYWKDINDVTGNWLLGARFEPRMERDRREALFAGWKKAVSRALSWEEPA